MRIYFSLIVMMCMGGALFGAFPPSLSGRILFDIHQGRDRQAIRHYLEHVEKTGKHDFELLGNIGIRLLEQGAKSDDPDTKIMALFGAGVGLRPSLIHILEEGIKTPNPTIQLVALQFLARLEDDRSDQLIHEALTSSFLLTRLEAAHFLAQKKERGVLAHIEAILGRIPPEVRALLPQILVNVETQAARRLFKNFLSDRSEIVRTQTLLQLGQAHRDDFVDAIRLRLLCTSPAEKECAIIALTQLKDMGALEEISKLTEDPNEGVRLAALAALVHFGDRAPMEQLCAMARQKNLFALSLIGELGRPDDKLDTLLAPLCQENDLNVVLNATLSSLKLKQSHAITGVLRLLNDSNCDFGYQPWFSAGRGLSTWIAIPSATAQKHRPQLLGATLGFKEQLLRLCVELPEKSFLSVARFVLHKELAPLVPTTIELLINHQTDGSIALLKEYQQKVGAPLVRNYCNLALFRLGIEGPYEENLKKWLAMSQQHALIRFRENADTKPSLNDAYEKHALTPEESSRLLISVFEAFASGQNETGIEILLDAIANGHAKSKYALAGLLIRTTE